MEDGLIIAAVILLFVVFVIAVIAAFLKSPFKYPYFTHYFDVSGKRNPQPEDLIDQFLIEGNFLLLQEHNEKIRLWKTKCKKKIEHSILKKYRVKQYRECLDDDNAYEFVLFRQQTRYRQKDYVKKSYKVSQAVEYFDCDYMYLLNRDRQLADINYECTLREYHSKNQRRLLTKELRNKIMIRDNYTCQICGKYMPDEVGLQVDHIVPVSKGGRSISSNLQVLCSKCNGSKSNK